jgi:hypothetical protein
VRGDDPPAGPAGVGRRDRRDGRRRRLGRRDDEAQRERDQDQREPLDHDDPAGAPAAVDRPFSVQIATTATLVAARRTRSDTTAAAPVPFDRLAGPGRAVGQTHRERPDEERRRGSRRAGSTRRIQEEPVEIVLVGPSGRRSRRRAGRAPRPPARP